MASYVSELLGYLSLPLLAAKGGAKDFPTTLVTTRTRFGCVRTAVFPLFR